MKEKKECKIIQDLLPNYIEKLTNEESNIFIQEHLKECKECKKTLENMQKDLSTDIKENEKSKVNYIKKYNKKLKSLKIILLIILGLFIIRTGRNMIIMENLSNKANEHISSNNYRRTSTSYQGDTLSIIDYYFKNGKYVMIMNRLTKNETNNITAYNNGKTINIYYETGDRKIVELNAGVLININTINYFKSDNIITFIIRGITTNIKSVKCNGKECYLVNENLLGEVTYIDKETGLIIRNNTGTYTNQDTGNITSGLQDIRYEFGTVTDEIFVEPDISKYEVKE